jgi:predicted nucleotidyltransferase
MQLSDEQIKFLYKTIRQYLPSVEILVFGSRITNTAQKFSDLDIALRDKELIPLNILSQVKEGFSESDLPFKVDLMDFNRLSADFQKLILSKYELLEPA